MQLADLFMTYNARPATVMADDDGMHHGHHHGHDHNMIAGPMYHGAAADQASTTTGTTTESASYSYNSPPPYNNSNCSTSAPTQCHYNSPSSFPLLHPIYNGPLYHHHHHHPHHQYDHYAENLMFSHIDDPQIISSSSHTSM